jgi:hypothetical protein
MNKPRLLDLFCGAGGIDIMPYAMVRYIHGKMRRIILFRLWQSSQGSNSEWGTNKSALPPMRSQTPSVSETEQLEEKGITSTLERWYSLRTKRLSLYCCSPRQPIPFNGRWQGESI